MGLREPDDQGKIPIAIVYLSVALATRKPPAPKQDDSIVWIEAPSDAVLVEFQIWITEAARRLSLHDVELVGVLPLASGDRQIVVVAMPREAPPEMEFDLQFDGDAPGWVERARSAAPNLMLWTINNQICRIVDGAELHGPSTV